MPTAPQQAPRQKKNAHEKEAQKQNSASHVVLTPTTCLVAENSALMDAPPAHWATPPHYQTAAWVQDRWKPEKLHAQSNGATKP